MSELGALFKTPDTSMGVFYPTNYVIATFRSFEAAASANEALRRAGFTEDDSRAVPGSDLLDYFDEIHEHSGVWGSLMTELSRLIGTEAAFEDKDARQARHGAGFVAAHCSTEVEAERIRKIVQPFEPLSKQWYWSGAIRSLIKSPMRVRITSFEHGFIWQRVDYRALPWDGTRGAFEIA